MKTLLILSFLILNTDLIKAQNDTLIIKEGYSNLAVFISDFVSNDFDGGAIYHLPKNNIDSLLFQIDYQAPSDFGSIEFKHLPSNKVAFKGKIAWDGFGSMDIPDKLVKPPDFAICKNLVRRPKQYQHCVYGEELKSYIQYPKIMAAELSTVWDRKVYAKEFEKLKTLEDFLDRVWKSIANLTIVNNLVRKNCKVGFYLYTPAVGMFDPTRAKWITFLYVN